LDVRSAQPRVIATARTGGEVRSVAFSPNGTTVYAAAADKSQVVVLDAAALKVTARYDVPGRPWAVLPSADGTGIFVADFDGDRVLRLAAASGKIEATSDTINRPSCLALSPDGSELFTVSFRTGEILVLNSQCATLRRLSAPSQLNQCRTVTLAPDGLLYAPQTRSDTVVGGRTFDRTVFPVIAASDPRGQHVSLKYFPDLLVVPPHRPSEVAVDAETVYLASAGSDDVLAIQRNSGFAKWHTRNVGLEPGGIALDPTRGRLHVLTITGQEIVSLSAESGAVLGRSQFAHDPTPPTIARGRYLFGTGTDKRLTKDQWTSCAICHPEGDTDGRQWNFGSGPLDTRSLRGCLQTAPLHLDAHGDEIQDTYDFTRLVMGGQWFVPRERLHDYLAQTNAGANEDLDALAAYIRSLTPLPPPVPPAATAPLRQKGKEIFFSRETRCAQCHPPPLYTDSGQRDAQGRYLLHDVATRLPYESATLQRLDTPSLLGLRRSEPYLHHGRAKTLEEVFSWRFNPQDKHGRTSHVSEEGIRALAEFLRYLDAYADGNELTVSGNIVRHNASYGLHLYPSIKNSRIVNNLVYGQVRRRGIIVACPEGGGKNVIVNNTVVEDQPLTIWNGNGEVVVNNILVADGADVFSFDESTQNVLVDYNFCVPKCARQGPHGLTGDPKFVDPTKGVFWLREGSGAIGKGTPDYAPATDFWGRPRPKDKIPDLGVFAFVPILTGEQVRADWDNGWAYHRHGNKVGLPDPWVLPVAERAKGFR